MDVITKAHELGKLITEDARHIAWTAAKEKHDGDETLQANILKFNTVRNDFMQANGSAERDEDKIAELSKEMRTLYESVMTNEVMVKFLEAQQDVNMLVNEINGLIQFYVTGEDPAACGGSCSSCAGCN